MVSRACLEFAKTLRGETDHAMIMKLNLDSPDLALMAYEPGAYAFYRWDDIAVNVWLSHPTGEAVRVLARLTEESSQCNPQGLSSIHWIENAAGLPTPDARHELAEIVRHYEGHIICVAVLLRGSGFWASAVRSALTGVALLSPKRFPLRFFADLPGLSSFVEHEHQQRVGQSPRSTRIATFVTSAAHHVTTLTRGGGPLDLGYSRDRPR